MPNWVRGVGIRGTQRGKGGHLLLVWTAPGRENILGKKNISKKLEIEIDEAGMPFGSRNV